MAGINKILNGIVSESDLKQTPNPLRRYAPGEKTSLFKRQRLLINDETQNALENLATDIACKKADNLYDSISEYKTTKTNHVKEYIKQKAGELYGIFLGSVKAIHSGLSAAVTISYNNNYAIPAKKFLEALSKCHTSSAYEKLEKNNSSIHKSIDQIKEKCIRHIDDIATKCSQAFDKDFEDKKKRQLDKAVKKCEHLIKLLEKEKSADKIKGILENIKNICKTGQGNLDDNDTNFLNNIFAGKSRQWKKFEPNGNYENTLIQGNAKTNWAIINFIASFIQKQAEFDFDKQILTSWKEGTISGNSGSRKALIGNR